MLPSTLLFLSFPQGLPNQGATQSRPITVRSVAAHTPVGLGWCMIKEKDVGGVRGMMWVEALIIIIVGLCGPTSNDLKRSGSSLELGSWEEREECLS